MDIIKYNAGFNLGVFFSELNEPDDLSKRIREVLEQTPQSDYSKGFAKGYFYGRSQENQKARIDELNQIQNSKDRDLEGVER